MRQQVALSSTRTNNSNAQLHIGANRCTTAIAFPIVFPIAFVFNPKRLTSLEVSIKNSDWLTVRHVRNVKIHYVLCHTQTHTT